MAYWVGKSLAESSVYVVPVSGGSPQKLETNATFARDPVWSPDGEHILFVGTDETRLAALDTWDGWVASAEGGEARRTGIRETVIRAGMADGDGLVWIDPSGVLFSARSGDTVNLYQATIEPGTWRMDSAPQQLTHGVSEKQPSVANDGRIAYASPDRNADIWAVPIDANKGKLTGEPEPVENSISDEGSPTVSADGSRLAFTLVRSGNADVWVRDNVTGRSSALVVTPELSGFRALLSPDGSTVAFARMPYGNAELFVSPFEGGPERKLMDGVATIVSWSADSTRILYATKGLATWNTINVSTGEIARLLDNSGNHIHSPELSPDGNWLLVKTLEGSETGAGGFITPIRNGEVSPTSDWIKVVESRSGNEGWWSPDGNLVYFHVSHEGSQCLWASRLNPITKQPVGEAFDVFHIHEDRRTVGWAVVGLSSDHLYLIVRETKANIWLAKPQTPQEN